MIGVDRNREALAELARHVPEAPRASLRVVCADLEDAPALPFRAAWAPLVVVTRFLHRPSCAGFAALLAPGGLLVYETFLTRQRELGRGPRRGEFLLEDGELPRLFPELEVLDYRETLRDAPQREWVASLLARRPA